jgi:IS1 family transposase
VNRPLIEHLSPSHVKVVLQRVDEAEVDEMWSFVGRKKEPRWLYHALDQRTGQVLASVFGRRTDEVFRQLKALLTPFGITRDYTGIGEQTNGSSLLKSTAPANTTRNKSSVNISHSAHASRGWCAR